MAISQVAEVTTSAVKTLPVSAEIAASIIKGRRTRLLIVPETPKILGFRGPIAILEPYRIDIDADYGLTASYQALGDGDGWRGAPGMPTAVSRITFKVNRVERIGGLPTADQMFDDGVYDVGDQLAWQSMPARPRLFRNAVSAWCESAMANWPDRQDGPFVALYGQAIIGNVLRMRANGERI